MPRGVAKKAVEKETSTVKDVPRGKENAGAKAKCASCNCPRDMHYGSAKLWCNSTGCQCQELQ